MRGFYILGGYPDLQFFEQEFSYITKVADFVEVGLPFNDPVADGPVIAKAASEVLEKKATVKDILKIVEKHKKSKVYLMSYGNIFYQYDLKNFSDDYKHLVDGVIVADLPNRMHNFFFDKGFEIPIIPFATPESRLEDLLPLKNSFADFIYFIGLRGVTGGSVNFLDESLIKKVKTVKEITSKKIVFGFGIKSKEDTKKVLSFADGFVIGTEVVKRQVNINKVKEFVDTILN